MTLPAWIAPQLATRVRWNMNTDTPLPPEEPASANPPDGAIIDYWLASDPSGPVTVEVVDGAGVVVRRYSSADPVTRVADGGHVPRYWIRPTRVLGARAGAHRFLWDLKYQAPAGFNRSFPVAAVKGNTDREPDGVWVMPGRYQVRLTVNGQRLTQPLVVRMDPRVKTPAVGLLAQFQWSRRISLAADAIARLSDQSAVRPLLGQLQQLYSAFQNADVTPTDQLVAATRERLAEAALKARGTAPE